MPSYGEMGLMDAHICVNVTSEFMEDKIKSTHSCECSFFVLLTKGLPLSTEPCVRGKSKYTQQQI